MSVIANVLISVAAAALFFLVEPYLLGLAQPWKWVAAVAVLIGAGGMAYLIGRPKSESEKRARTVLVDNEAGKDLEIIATHVDMTGGRGDVLSRNKAKGNAKINISGGKL